MKMLKNYLFASIVKSKSIAGITCAAAMLFAAVGTASATTINVSVGQDFGDFANSYYTVDATFVLPVGFSNAVLNTSLFAADDRAVLQLNGTNVSETGIFGPGSGSFYFLPDGSDNAAYNFRYGNSTSTFDPITGPFVVGTNTLHFIVNNTLSGIFGGPTPNNHAAVFFEGTVSFDAVSAVPEPSTWAMMLLGFAGIGYGAYRRKKSAPATLVA
ncbi:PEPxxWA-CTERM sorting domain-containing protein [Bradyrhizobium sp. AZCC 1693]|uniref:PEPxxWA-CTERM sorting domain-containing protein n=1 Tax=Bradyrhizobium sp. AZCC 1693 TaxID=3117029 RepID=UPI002FF232CE